MVNFSPKKASISLKDKFTLSPIEKHIYYSFSFCCVIILFTLIERFPFKLILHILLVAFTTIQVLVVVDSDYTQHAREQFRVFKYIFLDSSDDDNTQQFLTIGDFQNHLQTLSENFQNMNDELFQHYFDTHADFSIGIYYTMPSFDEEEKANDIYPIDLSSGTLGPIDPSNITSLKYWTSVASLAQLQANNLVTTIHSSENSRACMSWNISISYNFETFSQIWAEIKATNRYCSVVHGGSNVILGEFKRGNYFVNVVVLVVSTISLILSIRHVYAAASVYMTARFYYKGRNKNTKDYSSFIHHQGHLLADAGADEEHLKKFLDMDVPWESLPLSEKVKFFDFWFIFGIFGNCVQMIASLSIILTFRRNVGQDILTRDNIFVGFGCFFAWIQIMYYLQYSRKIILLTSTFSKSLTETLVFFGLTAPLFLGFTFLLQTLFWSYDRFDSTGDTIESLISMACGYVVYDIFNDTMDEGLVRQIFIYFYFLTFYTSVNEIFVSIVMEGYDRCTIRKEIDNDDPFPLSHNLTENIKKSSNENEKPSRNVMNLAPSPMHFGDLSPLLSQAELNTQNLIPFEQESDLMTVCMNKLNRRKLEIYEKLATMSETYSSINKDLFNNDDLIYLQNIYTESLNKILVRIQRYETKKGPF